MANPLPQVVFRADGNTRIGLGHLTRCLALAEMLQPHFACCFLVRDPDEAIQGQLLVSGFDYSLVPTGLPLLAEARWLQEQLAADSILVLDGYEFTDAYRRELKRHLYALVCLDDLASQHSWCDVIINAAGGVSSAAYSPEPGAMLCLGPAYALLRQPFREAAQRSAHKPNTTRIFLNMGGADPHNQTLAALQQLRQHFSEHQIAVVTGAAYPHQQALSEYIAHQPLMSCHHNLSATAMAELLASCGVFVCPPSGMAYECCVFGGVLLLHLTAENQRSIFDFLVGTKLALPFTDLATVTAEELPLMAHDMQARQRTIFDGAATQRYQQVFGALHLAYSLSIRRATAEDMKLYFTWANDAQVRHHAVQSAPIAWATHEAWFSRRLTDPDSYLYVLELGEQPVGQVRIEFEAQAGTIDYSVAADFRGRGLGSAILRRTFAQLRQERPAPWTLIGQVKTTNPASCRVFERLGFSHQSSVELYSEQYEIFVCHAPAD